MPDFTATRPHVYVSGAIIFASNHNNNETTLYNSHNSAFNASTGHTHSGTTGDGPLLTIASFSLPELPPVGSIIPFYDFGGTLTFDAANWAYCNGANATFTGIGSQPTPDLSNRYLVGFGTEGGTDIGSAAWSTTVQGLASHQSNLQHSHTVDGHTHTGPSHTHTMANHTHTGPSHTHAVDPPNTTSSSNGAHTHTVNSHTHTGPSHTHTGPSHTHSNGSYAALVSVNFPGDDGIAFQAATVSSWNATRADDAGSGTTAFTGITEGADVVGTSSSGGTGATGSGGTGATGGSSPATNSQGAHTHTTNVASFTSGSGGTGASGTPSNNTSDAGGTGATGSTGPGTDNQLSTTQSIQPRSISVRFIIRIT